MTRHTSPITLLATILAVLVSLHAPLAAETASDAGWVSLFDGKSLDGWTASENKASCRVEDGVIAVGGERSHLFYSGPVDNHKFTDFELKLEVMTTPGSNSGIFFHTEYQETGWPAKGHEAQVNNSHSDWRRTGSLYLVQDVRESPVKDNEWFRYHIIVRGKQVTLKINGETINEYSEADGGPQLAERPGRKLSSGTIALQAHDPGSLVYFRNIRIKTSSTAVAVAEAPTRPNILLLMSDNHSWNHLGVYGDPVVKTPNIDKIARAGVKFTHAFCASPSCTPARAGMLTGQDIWRLEEGANLWGILPNKFPVYTDLLRTAGYLVGTEGKGWGPGSYLDSGREINHGGKQYESFDAFMNSNTEGKPWTYWFSSTNPHRPYDVNPSERSGLDKSKVVVPSYLPDNEATRGDILDYYLEIQAFDDEVGEILETLKQSGQWDHTIIVICGDNGWQMPRGLANLYDFGSRIPLIFYWKGHILGDRTVDDFVNLNDLAPTFLEINGLAIPAEMTAKSLTNLLYSKESGRIEQDRDFVVTARERHALCRLNGVAYPGRAIRTHDFLYIRNFESDRWPAGDPPLYGDVDAHMQQYPSPTKNHILANRSEPGIAKMFAMAFAKRLAEELYDLKNDPDQMNNVATDKSYGEIKKKLAGQLHEYLVRTKDPRVLGQDIIWDGTKYYATQDFQPKPSQEAIDAFGLKKRYNYFPGENNQNLQYIDPSAQE